MSSVRFVLFYFALAAVAAAQSCAGAQLDYSSLGHACVVNAAKVAR